MRLTIRHKVLSLIFIILVPMLSMSIYNIFLINSLAREDIRNHNQMIAADVADYFDSFIDKSFSVLQVLAKHPAVTGMNTEESNRIFSAILATHPEYLNIQATDMKGFNYGSGISSPDIMKINYRDTEWFSLAKLGRPVIGNLTISKFFRVPTTMIAVPVFSSSGKQSGIVRVSLNLDKIRELLQKKWHLPEKSSIDVLDAKGNIILCSIHDEQPCQEIFNGAPFREYFVNNRTVEDENHDHMEKVLYSFSPISTSHWKIAVSVTADEAYKQASLSSRRSLKVLLFASSLAIVMSLVLARRLTRNVEQMSSGLRRIEEGDLSHRLAISGHDELRDLAETFNAMVEKRRVAEEKLKESESFTTSVLEGIGEGVIVIDRDFRIVSANHGYCEQVKKPCEEILGKHCYEVSHQAQAPCYEIPGGCECTVKKCFDTGDHHRSVHTHYDTAGTPRYIETNAYPLKDDDGNVPRVIETLIDITDMFLLEKRVEEIKERYRKLYDDAPEMMLSLDANCSIIICNRTLADALDYPVRELPGRPFHDFLTPASQETCQPHFELLKSAGAFEGEAVLVSRSGKEISVRINAKAVYDADRTFLMSDAVIQDISERKHLEAQLMHAQRMEAIGQLAGGTAHDFNNILMAIMGFTSILQVKLGESSPLSNYANQILTAAERGANLTRSLLAFSRKQVMQTKPVDLSSIVLSMEKMLHRIIGEDIQLRCFTSATPLIVEADAGQIEQVLVNLVANARDAMPNGGELSIETGPCEIGRPFIETHGYGKPGMYALMSIADTGEGIDEAALTKIFEPFYTTKESGKGTGLGLSIAYGIIKQHNGLITVESAQAKGAAFLIYLPLLAMDVVIPAQEEENREVPGGSETLLLAEDDDLIRASLTQSLSECGYTVIVAQNGEEAVAIFRQRNREISLFITDVIMPRKNGRDAFEEMRLIRPDLRVLYLSGYTANIIQEKGKLGEHDHFIQKPVRTGEFLHKIREALDQSRR